MTPPVFFSDVAGVAVGDAVAVAGDEGRHAADVRRLRAGEAVWLTDGQGIRLVCAVTGARRGELTVEVRDRVDVPRPEPRFTVVQALARGGRDEQAVESMTEVGVDHVIGWAATRNVVQWTDRTATRWAATSRSAAKQARRAWWPEITGPESSADVVDRCQRADLAVVLHEAADASLPSLSVPERGEIVVIVGPEGGITDEEREDFAAAGAHVVRLGDNVLRSSTAGVAALSVLNARTRWR